MKKKLNPAAELGKLRWSGVSKEERSKAMSKLAHKGWALKRAKQKGA